MPSSDTFLAAIDLTPTESPDVFTAVPQYVPWPKAYGGDLVAQAIVAASRTVESGRRLHSTHSYFLLPVDVDVPVEYRVERLREGRSYATREVRGYQHDKLAFVSMASFGVGEDGAEFAEAMPEGIPDPDSLPSTEAFLEGVDGPAAAYWSTGRSFDMRHVPGPIYLEVEGHREPHQAIWIKAYDRLPDDPEVHRAALAYVCDYTILEPLLRQQGRAWLDSDLMTASLDHSLWSHRDGRLDEWVLYVQDAASLQSGRGLARGRFHTRDGRLLASLAQEGMIRTRRS
jgi:acyl-CoA thioesterase-2